MNTPSFVKEGEKLGVPNRYSLFSSPLIEAAAGYCSVADSAAALNCLREESSASIAVADLIAEQPALTGLPDRAVVALHSTV